MFYNKHLRYSKKALLYVLLTAVMLTACGQEQDETVGDADSVYAETIFSEQDASDVVEEETVEISKTDERTENVPEADEAVSTDALSKSDEVAEADTLKERFGANCISEQTFEVELSECGGKVWFVPYAPSGAEDFHIQIIQDGEVLTDINGYVPEKLEEQEFSSLDAVAFFDVNYDNMTDIVLIETYGDTSFAAIYYGRTYTGWGIPVVFSAQEQISDNISGLVEPLTVPMIRSFLSNGKNNGEFTDYQEAYRAIGRLSDLETTGRWEYNLIYFDGDDIPELVSGVRGYYISLYTFHDGRIYTLMDCEAYGAGGNPGYEYVPGQNSMRNYNTDYAGLILYTTYASISDQYTMDESVQVITYNFDDANGNGIPDESEEASFGYCNVSYIDGVEITADEYASYNVGEYEYIEPVMSLEELMAALD